MDENAEYIVLTDNKHDGTIVKLCGCKHYLYVNGEWIRTGIMTEYFCDESPYYDSYEEITYEEAEKLMRNK